MFVSGNLPPNLDEYRNPTYHQVDLSLMKNFHVGGPGTSRFRAEAQNVFDIRGLGPTIRRSAIRDYGLITTAGNEPRQVRVSARVTF